MELNPIRFGSVSKKRETKTFFMMRAFGLLTILISLTALSQSTDTKISLSVTNAPIEAVFKEIKKQTGYEFVYTRSQIKKSVPVTLQFQSAPLNQILEACFKDQPFTYVIEGMYIVIKEKQSSPKSQIEKIPLSGRILDEMRSPVEAATVQVKGSDKATSSNALGEFSFPEIDGNITVVVSSVGYQTKEITVKDKSFITVTLMRTITKLDETIIIAYGTTTQRLNTGSVGKITSKEIENQPVSNPLATLQGRIPGLLVTQGSGISGSTFKVEIRGQSSIGAYSNAPYPVGNEPLYIIDGIPYTAGTKLNEVLNASTTPGDARSGGLSPLNLINPSEIESIEVLKDADATAIYGSRGANGVILITTKKGKVGKSKFEINIYSGASWVTRTLNLLTTSEYITMRKEAFRNDGITPTVVNAPDLLIFDTVSYTDFKKQFNAKNAKTFDVQTTYSGGNKGTQFLVGSGYHAEESLLPGDFKNRRPSMYLNLNHASDNNKFRIGFSSNYSYNNNNLTSLDLTQFVSSLPPNTPPLMNANGELLWEYGGVALFNPFAYLNQKYESKADNLMSNLSLYYEPAKNLQFKASFGFNSLNVNESSILPM
jgi:TonB-dependent SusC/RagA subfamily outer membrane receptor